MRKRSIPFADGSMLRGAAPMVVLACLWGVLAPEARGATMPELLEAYATQPQGYPTGPGYASPDTSVPYRWHFYNDDAINRHEDAAMLAVACDYNLLEGAGVSAGAGVATSFVTQHVTQGTQALRADFSAGAVAGGTATVTVDGVDGPDLKATNNFDKACHFLVQYRWLRLDAWNDGAADVHARIANVPIVLHPGANQVCVKTNDISGYRGDYPGIFKSFNIQVTSPAQDVAVYFDHVRMEQEVPSTISQNGRLFHFACHDDAGLQPILWPGFTWVNVDTTYSAGQGYGWTLPKSTRAIGNTSFRSHENGIWRAWCRNVDSPFRVDLPDGRYGVYIIAQPTAGWADSYPWRRGQTVTINGVSHTILPVKSDAQVYQVAWSGEAWDYRPGYCLWEQLFRPVKFPDTAIVYEDVTGGNMMIEIPDGTDLRAIMIFPDADQTEALKELGRFNYLMAESYDISRNWIKGSAAESLMYIGRHEEMADPSVVPAKLAALSLTAADFARGFVPFHRGLTEAVYPDSVPSPAEMAFGQLEGFAVPGEYECLTLSLLPLAQVSGLTVQMSDLTSGGDTIPSSAVDIRVSRQQQKCMQFGHHNHTYNLEEYYLVRRPALDLYPAAARRAYFDIAVPAAAPAGVYTAQITIKSSGGADLATAPVSFEVLPIVLEDAPVFYAGNLADDRLTTYGINTQDVDYDVALASEYKGYLNQLAGGKFGGTAIALNDFDLNHAILDPIIAAGLNGAGPRGFFGQIEGWGSLNATTANELMAEYPGIDVPGHSNPLYSFDGPTYCHDWQPCGMAANTYSDPSQLAQARQNGERFWFMDALRASKEQPARFTFGFWLWRLGAFGRYTTLHAVGDIGGFSYFSMYGPDTGSTDVALISSLTQGEVNPCRDLVLIREGVDDYRYIHTLEEAIQAAADGPAKTAAQQYRDNLYGGLNLDLRTYYEARNGAYAENYYPLAGNEWNGARFRQVRREIADHIMALMGLNQRPQGSITATPTVASVGEPVVFDASGSTDPDGAITLYEYDFDYDGVTFDVDASGAALSATTHSYGASGTYDVAVRVTDDLGDTDTAVAAIAIQEPTGPTDSDGDGLPDWWELQYYSHPDDCVPDEDTDADGLTNEEEYYAGTDPLEPDTDGDGIPDGDDLDPTHVPAPFGGGCGGAPVQALVILFFVRIRMRRTR